MKKLFSQVRTRNHRIICIFLFCSLTACLLSIPVSADDLIRGHSCYTRGDKESLKGALEVTRSLAIRNAIESYQSFITSISTVTNFQLTSDLVQIITSGYLKDIKVIEHSEKGRTICETIEAKIFPISVENIAKNRILAMRKETEESDLPNNGYLKILGITEKPEKGVLTSEFRRLIKVVFKRLKTGSPNCIECNEIYIDYFDSLGNPVNGERHFVDENAMREGEIRAFSFYPPIDVASWKVWLKQEKTLKR